MSEARRRVLRVGVLMAALAALGIVWPRVGVLATVVLGVGWGLAAIVVRPWRGIVFGLAFFPFYPLFRALVIVAFPTDLFGLRFWPEMVLLATFAGLAVQAIVRRRRFALRGVDLPALLYLILCGYGLILSVAFQHPLFSVYGFHVAVMPALFYFAVRWCEPDEVACAGLLRGFVATFLALAIPSFVDYVFRPRVLLTLAEAARPEVSEYARKIDGDGDRLDYWRNYARMQSLLFQENLWGTLCRFVSLLGLSWLVVRRDAWRRWLPLAGLATLGLILSVSRGSVVAWAVSVVALALLRRRYSQRLTLSLLALLMAVGAALLFASESPRVAYWLQMIDQVGFGTDRFAADRVYQWREGWQRFLETPSGSGLGTIGHAASSTQLTMTLVADNNYISVAAELGIPGLLLLPAWLVSSFWTIGTYVARVEDRWVQALGLTLLTFLAGACSHAVSANIFEFYYIMPLFWTFLAVFVTRCERLTPQVPFDRMFRSDVAATFGRR